MKIRATSYIVKILLVACMVLPCSAQGGPQQSDELKVRVSAVPSAIVIYRDVTGPYDQHPEVFTEMMKYVGLNYRAVGACFGIYPNDPDAVRATQLHWQVGVRVEPGRPLGYGNSVPIEQYPVISKTQLEASLRTMKQPDAPYKLMILTETNAAQVESTVAAASKDGLAMFPWMAKNGYVQIGPTRMEYHSHEGSPSEIKVTIIVPVKERPSGLRLEK
jgi:hypothetical protein